MIGLSLSFCIQDLIEGKHSINDVHVIITSTKCRTEEEWDKLYTQYCQSYWKQSPAKAYRFLIQLRASGRIVQPRVNGQEPFNISGGHWLKPLS